MEFPFFSMLEVKKASIKTKYKIVANTQIQKKTQILMVGLLNHVERKKSHIEVGRQSFKC